MDKPVRPVLKFMPILVIIICITFAFGFFYLDTNKLPDDVYVSTKHISSITYNKGSGAGTLSNTQIDDTNYFQINPKTTWYGGEIQDYVYNIDVTFDIDPWYGGRDFYFSCNIVSGTIVTLTVNGVEKASGTSIVFDNVLITDVTSIRLVGGRWTTTFNSKVYYFEIVEK